MKKALTIIALCVTVLICSLCLVGCNFRIVETGHTHFFREQNVEDKFLCKKAACGESALYYYSCECGEMCEETFGYGEYYHEYEATLSHDRENHYYKCKLCGEKTAKEEHLLVNNVCACGYEYYSKGLRFILSNDGASYIVDGGTWNDTEPVIPSKYNNLPVVEIGTGAFQDCEKLTSIKIPSSVTHISSSAFDNCYLLQSVEIPNSVTRISAYAFSNCYSLSSVEIPHSVKAIGVQAFEYCTSLQSVEIPGGVTHIREGVFANCSSLKEVVIPNGVEIIDDYVFRGCSSLNTIKFIGTMEKWATISKGWWSDDVPTKKVNCSNGQADIDI